MSKTIAQDRSQAKVRSPSAKISLLKNNTEMEWGVILNTAVSQRHKVKYRAMAHHEASDAKHIRVILNNSIIYIFIYILIYIYILILFITSYNQSKNYWL